MKRRSGFLVKRGKTYHAAWYVDGKRYQQTTGETSRRKAEVRMKEIIAPFVMGDEVEVLRSIASRIEGRSAEIAKIEDERNPPTGLMGGWSAYLAAPGRPDSGPATLQQYEYQYFAFVDWMKEKHPARKAMRDVSPEVSGEYAHHLIAERNLTPNTFNKHIRLLELVYRILHKSARIEENPWAGITRKTVVMQSRRELTTDELRSVCAAAEGELRTLFALGIYTGMRLGDCATLEWSDVDLPRRIIRRIPNKTARRNPKPITIPIHPVLWAMLDETPKDQRGEYVLSEIAALHERDRQSLSERIQKHFESCGVRTVKKGTGYEVRANDEGKVVRRFTGKRAVVEVGFHSLRHTFVSLCREANAPLAVVEAIVGHANPAMTRHYTHVGELAASAAVNSLPSVLGDEPKVLPAADPMAALKERIATLAGQLNSKTWKQIRDELKSIHLE